MLSARSSSGVLISFRSGVESVSPITMSMAQTAALAIQVVNTAVFKSVFFFAPNSLDTITEQPMLHPNAKAMKISVIS